MPLRRRVLVGIACSAAVVGLARFGGSPALTATHPDPLSHVTSTTATVVVFCAEDDPCWSCRTMGNRRCGP